MLSEWSTLRKLIALKAASAAPLVEQTATGNPATFSTTKSRKLTGFTIPFTPVQASGTPSPENVLPISGYNGIYVFQNSKNVIDSAEYTNGYYLNDSGTPTATQYNFHYTTNYIPAVSGTVMRYYGTTEATGRVRVHEYDSNKQWLRQAMNVTASGGVIDSTFTVSQDAAFIRYSAPGGISNEYLGVSIGVDWTDGTGTVYGGTLDAVTGVLTVNTKLLAFGDDAGWASVGTKFYATIDDTEFAYIASDQLSNMELYGGISWQGSAGVTTDKHFYLQKGSESNPDWNRIWVYDSAYTLDTFKALLAETPIQFTIPITPQTIQLDPFAVRAIAGSNVIWTDTNGTNTIKYLTGV